MKKTATITDRCNPRVRALIAPVLLGALVIGGLSAAATAQAGQYGVRVVNDLGEPVSGASVCIGLPGNYKQFGALFTDVDGRAVVEVPNVPLVVTVSKTRFSGLRLNEPARGFNLIKQVTLSEGIPGPRCRAGSTMVANPPIIRIDTVDVLSGASNTVLRPAVSGGPSHYRISSDAGFSGASWQSFSQSIALPAALAGAGELYLQMRRVTGNSKSWVDARSDVVTVNLPEVH
ncbi:MAG: hypothetical protein HKN42_07735 [Granulosicoccus sp.]|nr:hypothetical protein [Granulosicoccus sp.]